MSPRHVKLECNNDPPASLQILADAARTMAGDVRAGRISFTDAVDHCHSAAVWADLPETVGENIVQFVLAQAFGCVPGVLSLGETHYRETPNI